MGQHDTQEVCLNGHQITGGIARSPSSRREFCPECGEPVIHQCPSCNANIKGFEESSSYAPLRVAVPRNCDACGVPYPWTAKRKEDPVTTIDPAASITRICERIPLVIRQLRDRHSGRDAHLVNDEYDLQDLLHSLLYLFFDDVRAEEYTPSYAGKAARMDFFLKDESIVIEAKMTRKGLEAKELGDELTIDIARYRAHHGCKKLYCLIYDPEHRVKNPRGVEADLVKNRDDFQVKVFIVP